MIETRGPVALIEAPLMMVGGKKPHAWLVGVKQIGGGLCTAMVRGDAAAQSRNRWRCCGSALARAGLVHVIPRPHGRDPEEAFPISSKGDSNI
ncbi:ethanolamine utilization protein EutM [Salmonella enterica subsp. enterica]|nr:ethanolamine utilization protein EutM [Salmonella enterica subsp. enterica]